MSHPERKPNRLPGFDYTSSNHYFVTVNVDDRSGWFGTVRNGIIGLNENGCIVNARWLWLAQQYPYVELDDYVVMPNHFHGIIIINNPDDGFANPVHNIRGGSRPAPTTVETDSGPPVKIKSLSSLMGAFQTTSSKRIHELDPDFQWQRSFHDRVIRDADELDRIRRYIRDNPVRWWEKHSGSD